MLIGFLLPFFVLLLLLHVGVNAVFTRLAPQRLSRLGQYAALRGYVAVFLACILISIPLAQGFVSFVNELAASFFVSQLFFVCIGFPLSVFFVQYKKMRLILCIALSMLAATIIFLIYEASRLRLHSEGIGAEVSLKLDINFVLYALLAISFFYLAVFWRKSD